MCQKSGKNAIGVFMGKWQRGRKNSIDQFYVAKPEKDTAETMNQALEEGKNLLLTPEFMTLRNRLL